MSEDSDSIQQPKPLESNDEELTRVKSESLYRILFDNAADAIAIHDVGGKFLEVNRALCERLGYSREELLRMTPADISSPEHAGIIQQRVETLGKAGHAFFETVHVRRDGTTIPIEMSTRVIEYKGKPAVLSFARDITDRKKAEEALRESEERYRLLFEKSPVGIGLASVDGRIVSANEIMQAITGYSAEELGEIRLADTYENPADRERLLETFKRDGAVADYPARLKRKDGTPYHALLSVSRISIAGKDLLQTTCIDITDRKRAEEALRESESRYRALFDSASDAIFIHDMDRNFLEVNKVACELLGYSRDELLRMTPKDIQGAEYVQFVATRIGELLKVGHAIYETVHVRRDGTPIPIEVSGRIIEYKGKPAVLSIARDITERKLAEQKLRLQSEIVANVFEGVVVTRASDDVIVYANPRFEQMFGYGSGELIGKNIAVVNAPIEGKSPEDTAREIGTSLNESGVWVGEIHNVKKNRTPFWCRANVSALESSEYGRIRVSIQEDITERKKMEEELRRYSTQLETLVAERTRELAASKDFAENLIETADAMVVGLDNHGNVRFFNQATTRITGYTIKELEGRNWFEVIVPRGRYPEVWRAFERLTPGGLPKNFENPILTKSGEEHYVVWRNNEVREQGQIVGTISFGIDITERKRMEEAIRESERRFRNLIDDSAVAMAVFSRLQGDVHLINRKFTELLGYTLEDVPDLDHWWPLAYPDQKYRDQVKAEWNRRVEKAVETQSEVKPMELSVTCKDGSTREVELHSSWIGDSIVSSLIDLTERKRMEEELRAARVRLEYVIASNPAVIYTGKPLADRSDFVLTYLSDRVVSMLGFEPQEFIGHPEFWQARVHPEDLRSIMAEMPRLWREGQYSFDYRFLHKDGTYRWIREGAKTVLDIDGKPIEVNGYWTNITERKRLEEELVKSQRLATIGETSAMVGHDLRNPLQGIAGVVYLAKRNLESRKVADRKAAARLLDTIQEQVVYMDKIVSDLQDYAQPLTPKLDETNLPDLIRQTLSTIKMPKAVKVSMEIEKTAENVMVDPALMRRTLANLAINAIQAMPKRGKLTIRARRQGDSTIIAVEDTGAGIPKKNLAKVFNPFFTTKAKGQGLGLAVCKRLVEAQGGSITVKNKPRKGKGTAFTIKMPRGKREVAS